MLKSLLIKLPRKKNKLRIDLKKKRSSEMSLRKRSKKRLKTLLSKIKKSKRSMKIK
jgi:hypothetical protein